jgi:hypothetical protein
MDLSDLPSTAVRLIAEAEIEARYILRSEAFDLCSAKAPQEALSEGRNQAARHLFHATAAPLWERVRPDLDAFKARLDDAKTWVDNRFHPYPSVLNKAAAWEIKWARREVAKNWTAARPQVRPRGVLGAALMRHQQALKEGRLEGYVDRPSAAPTLVARGLSGVAPPSPPETALVPLVNVSLSKRLATVQDATPQPAAGPFATREQREGAIKRAAAQLGGPVAAARSFRVDYRDFRKWARQRSLAKGHSLKSARIEQNLLRYCLT